MSAIRIRLIGCGRHLPQKRIAFCSSSDNMHQPGVQKTSISYTRSIFHELAKDLIYRNRSNSIETSFENQFEPMRRSDLGEFEEVVLLTVAVLAPNAYSVAIAEDLEKQMEKTVTTGAVHAALQRLENKGYVNSHMGEATRERGGRRKRLFTVTIAGSKILQEVREVRENLWNRMVPQSLPQINFALYGEKE